MREVCSATHEALGSGGEPARLGTRGMWARGRSRVCLASEGFRTPRRPAPQPPLARVDLEPNVPGVATAAGQSPACAAAPLRGAARPGTFDPIEERIAAVIPGQPGASRMRAHQSRARTVGGCPWLPTHCDQGLWQGDDVLRTRRGRTRFGCGLVCGIESSSSGESGSDSARQPFSPSGIGPSCAWFPARRAPTDRKRSA